MKTRAQFRRVAAGAKAARPGVVVQARRSAEAGPEAGSQAGFTARVGFTATRKIGGAVVRNRAKRRLREAARLLAPLHARAGVDYVFIARAATAERAWPRLLDDVKSALISLEEAVGDASDARCGRPPSSG